MKKTIALSISLVFVLLCLVSCDRLDTARLIDFFQGNTVDAEGLWENATYRKDMELGEGETAVYVEVKVGEESVTFTINTDKEYLGEALVENELIEGEEGAYGLYVKKVNGIYADYNVNGAYWALYIDGEMAMSGVDSTKIADGEHYELVYTK